MLRVVYSNRTEALLDALCAQVAGGAGGGARGSPFEALQLVVPNRNVGTYLTLGLARAHGVAANVRLRFLEELFGELVAEAIAAVPAQAAPAPAAPALEVLDLVRLQGHLLALLSDDGLLEDAELGPVRAYLHAGGEQAEVIDRRRAQLAGRLAHLFDEYALSRPDLLDAWAEGPRLGSTPYAAAERWQRRLWLAIVQAGQTGQAGQAGPAAPRRCTLTEAVAWCGERVRPPPVLHLFGFSYMASGYAGMLRRLAERTAVYIYALNPCREYWEDVRRGGEPADPSALAVWGRPGRDHVRLLNELCDWDFGDAFVDPESAAVGSGSPPTLLEQLQHDLLWRAPMQAPASREVAARTGLRVLACPSMRREVEVVARHILGLLARDTGREPLRLNEVAVIINAPSDTERQAYHAHIAAVFGEDFDIPYHLADLSLAAHSACVEAAELLLDLPLSAFTRQDLLRLVTHPAVIGRFPEASPEEWLGLCERLSIVHGADHADHAGTYLERDLYNWDQGLRRLVVGAFMAGERSGESTPFQLGGQSYLPEELPSGQLTSALRFVRVCRGLIDGARALRQARMPLRAWAQRLAAFLAAELHAADETQALELSRCTQAAEELARLDVDGREHGYALCRELLRGRLRGLRTHRGHFLAEKLVVAEWLPMRALPFRHIFVLGLGEGRFPRRDHADLLDLRQAEPRPGDVGPREQDQYLFLETLLCAREGLHLSYVARDPLTGDSLAPSPLVSELLEMCRQVYLGDAATERCVERHPLRRHEPWPAPEVPPGSAEEEVEGRLRALGDALRRRLGRPRGALRVEELPALVGERGFAELAGELRLARGPGAGVSATTPAPAPTGRGGVVRLSLSALERFLKSPLDGWARTVLRLQTDEEADVLALEDELFDLGALARSLLLREVFEQAALRTGRWPTEASLAAVHQELALRAELRGQFPTGAFGEAERGYQQAVLRTWVRQLEGLGVARPGQLSSLRFGRAEVSGPAEQVVDPLVLDLGAVSPSTPGRLELGGRTLPLLAEPAGSLILVARGPVQSERVRQEPDRMALRGFLNHLMLTATGLRQGVAHTSYLLFGDPDHPSEAAKPFAPLGADEARDYLGRLAAELLGAPHAYLLPGDAVFLAHQTGQPIGDCVARVLADRNRPSFEAIPEPEGCSAPPEEEARAMVERRFGLYFRLLQKGGG